MIRDINFKNLGLIEYGKAYDLMMRHLKADEFFALKERIEASEKFNYYDEPYRRFINKDREQETFFIQDPSGNVLEIKTMVNPETLWS